jgi:hypothetical protein
MFPVLGRRLTVLMGVLLSGCGSDLYQTAIVVGTVTCNGQPALGGFVVFEPMDAPEKTGRPKGEPGSMSRGQVAQDGSFTLMTEVRGTDQPKRGALIGPHRVSFVLPKSTPWEMDPGDSWLPPESQAKLKAELASRPVFPKLPCGAEIMPTQVDVVDGENRFEFTLAGAPRRALTPARRLPTD